MWREECGERSVERGERFHFLPSEDGTILAVGVGTTDVGSVWSARAGIETYHALGVEGEEHALGAEHVLPKYKAALAFLLQETHVGRETLANNSEETGTVHSLKHYPTLSAVVNTELACSTLIFV